MLRSLFLFDMTFWLYLAAFALYVAYVFARKPAMQMAVAGHPAESSSFTTESDQGWAVQIGQVATIITVFGWMMNTAALFTRAMERMQNSGTFAPWSNQFEAMAYVSWAIILGYVLLRLPYAVRPIFEDWLTRNYPQKADRVLALIRSTREGRLNDPQYGSRMRGQGPYAEQIAQTVKVFKKKLGLDQSLPPLDGTQFTPPQPTSGQMRLF